MAVPFAHLFPILLILSHLDLTALHYPRIIILLPTSLIHPLQLIMPLVHLILPPQQQALAPASLGYFLNCNRCKLY